MNSQKEYKHIIDQLSKLKYVKPSDSFKECIYNVIEKLPDENPHKSFLFIPFYSMRLAAITIIIFLFTGTGVVFASQNAKPGSILYPVRRVVTDVKISLSTKPQEKAVLNLKKSQIKLHEIEKNIHDGDGLKLENAIYEYGNSLENIKNETDLFKKADNEIAEKIIKGLEKQEGELKQIMQIAPENSQKPLQKAIESASEAKENASQVRGSSTENKNQNPQETKESEKSGETYQDIQNIKDESTQNRSVNPAVNKNQN